jgi:dTDP-4-dehydrorhamnose reductase
VRVLVIGGDGMLGHQLFKGLGRTHDVRVTLRRPLGDYGHLRLFNADNAYSGVDVRSTGRLAEVLAAFRPQVVCNAAGIVKQRPAAHDALASIEVNALFPHRLAAMAREIGARVVHVSTDCVFSGARGRYTEDDIPDPVDLYARSKLLGELEQEGCLTLRTSVIGLELEGRRGLVEWALSQRGTLRGFRGALYSGVTTAELTRVFERVLTRNPDLHGVWHVASAPISKYDLLVELFSRLGRADVEVIPDDTFVCDRTLRADGFNRVADYHPPACGTMLDELGTAIRVRRAGEPA